MGNRKCRKRGGKGGKAGQAGKELRTEGRWERGEKEIGRERREKEAKSKSEK